MTRKGNWVLILSAMMLAACGGGGGGGGGASPTLVRTSITGTVTPPLATASGPVSPSANVLTPPNSTGTWPSIVQGTDFTYDLAAAKAATPLKIVSANIKPVDTQTASTSIITGAATPDPMLGQPVTITNTLAGTSYTVSTNTGGTLFFNAATAGLPTPTISLGTGTVTTNAAYILQYSPTLYPAGYTYQTFGGWASKDTSTGVIRQYFFSTGAPTTTALPISGTASYTGHATGTYVNAATRDPADIAATLNATADFAALKVSFSTTGTTVWSANAAPGALPVSNPGLDMSGTLGYAAGSNTFTGTVTTANGMGGNATGRFYGPGVATATPTKVAGAPPEIGGTFAVMNPVGGAMQGAFGGK